MAESSKRSINVSSDDVTSQSSFYMGSDGAFSHSSIYKSSDDTFSGSSIFKGSDETYDIFCVPCQEIENKFLPADGYCTNCEEHLCFDCRSNHRKNKVSRHHKLQDKHTMPQSKQVATKSSLKTTIISPKCETKDSTPHEINIGSSTDKTSCWITGMALLPDSQLAITDFNNSKVKLVDTRQYKIVYELSLMQPLDVTYVPEHRLAVTLRYDNTIQFLTISSRTLFKENKISVNGQCRGIAYNDKDQSIVVTFSYPGKVEIISLSGEVIRCIEINNTGGRIFECPLYVALNNDNTGMFVSDDNNHSVTFLTLDGNVKSVYKNETLNRPKGLCLDQAGRVFVADSEGSGTVHQLVPGNDKLQPLLDEAPRISETPYSHETQTSARRLCVDQTERVFVEDDSSAVYQLVIENDILELDKTHGINSIYSVAYCDTNDTLYVGKDSCAGLKVFQLQQEKIDAKHQLAGKKYASKTNSNTECVIC